jgi:hypothetical protein
MRHHTAASPTDFHGHRPSLVLAPAHRRNGAHICAAVLRLALLDLGQALLYVHLEGGAGLWGRRGGAGVVA